MKNYFILTCLLVTAITTNAQFRWLKGMNFGGGNQQTVIGVNMESMMSKIGEEKLLEMLNFKKGNSDLEQSVTQKKEATERKRALAAIYGAGIDFTKKMWIVPNTIFNGTPQEEWERYSEKYAATIIPIKNKQVVVENIGLLLNKNNEGNMQKKETNGITYFSSTVQYSNTLVVVTNAELIITNTPYANVYDYNIYGRTIKTDSVVNDIAPPTEIKEELKIEAITPKTYPIIEIDKWDNGTIKRIVKNKEATKNNDYKVVEATTMAADTAVMAAAPTAGANVVFDKEEIIKKAKIDTLTRTAYSNGKMYTIYYVPYTEEERNAAYKQKAAIEAKKKTELVEYFIKNYSTIFVYNNLEHPELKKAVVATDDIIMLSSTFLGNQLGVLKYYVPTPNNVNKKSEYNAISTINFENGEIVGKFQAGCCNDNAKLLTNIYNPITSFMPSILSSNKYGAMRYHFNVNNALSYYKSILPIEDKLDKSLAEVGMQLADLDKLLTGEIAITIGAEFKENNKERMRPNFAIALKLRDPKLAVTKMNQIASKNIEMAANYRFAENGEYIIFSSKDFFNRKNTIVKNIPTPLGSFGEMEFAVKGFAKAMIMGMNENELKGMVDIFGTISMVNNKTEEGKFVTDFTMQIGDKSKNALVSYFDFMKKATETILHPETKSEVYVMPKEESTPTKRKVTKRGTTSTKKKTNKKK